MKTVNLVSLVAVAFALLLTSGCSINYRSGNVGGRIKNLPYDKGNAVVTVENKHTDPDGKTTTTTTTTTKTPLAGNLEVEHIRGDVATSVGIAKVQASATSIWSTPAQHEIGYGSVSYVDVAYDNSTTGGGHNTGSGGYGGGTPFGVYGGGTR